MQTTDMVDKCVVARGIDMNLCVFPCSCSVNISLSWPKGIYYILRNDLRDVVFQACCAHVAEYFVLWAARNRRNFFAGSRECGDGLERDLSSGKKQVSSFQLFWLS